MMKKICRLDNLLAENCYYYKVLDLPEDIAFLLKGSSSLLKFNCVRRREAFPELAHSGVTAWKIFLISPTEKDVERVRGDDPGKSQG